MQEHSVVAPHISLGHFERLMGPHGLYQHARGQQPNLQEGYCTDDNARAINFLLAWRKLFPVDAEKVENFLQRCWQYIADARSAPGTYYNFRDAQGRWLAHDVSEDMYARVARAYAAVIIQDSNAGRKKQAEELLLDLLPTLQKLSFPRAQAETILAIALLPPAWRRQQPAFMALAAQHLENLAGFWKQNATPDWPWFEAAATYANALLPHSILVGSNLLNTHTYDEILHRSAQFLLQATAENNIFMPIGSVGWYPQGGQPSRDNQQPIEAGLTLDFLLEYQASFPANVTVEQVAAPYLWFYGQNDHSTLLVDSSASAAFDGLFIDHINTNCGAESLLAYLGSEVRMAAATPDIQTYAYQTRNALLASNGIQLPK